MNGYGKELILDLHGCKYTEVDESFFQDLCVLIDMKREDLYFWGPADGKDAENPKISGVSAVQFILTSSIVVHGLDKLGSVYVNLFSCKDFDEEAAMSFIREWFGAERVFKTVVERTMP